MPRHEQILTVFMASPGDLAIEREVAEKVIRTLNIEWSRDINVRLDLLRWETHAFPASGVDAQSVINAQIGDEYDIFVGIMWQRFGTPTERSGSGTQEEFNRARQRHETNPNSVSIMMYFKDSPIAPSSLDLDEMMRIRDFRKSLKTELYWSFSSTEDFETKLRLHLVRQIQEWKRRQSPENAVFPASDHVTAPKPDLDNIDDAGLIDLIEIYEESFQELTEILSRITQAMNYLTEHNAIQTEKLGEISKYMNGTSRSEAKRIIESSASEMRKISDVIEIEIQNYANNFLRGVRAAITSIPIQASLGGQDSERQKEASISAMTSIDRGIETAQIGMSGFKEAVNSLPRMTTELNKSKRTLAQSIDKILDEWVRNRSLLSEAIEAISDS